MYLYYQQLIKYIKIKNKEVLIQDLYKMLNNGALLLNVYSQE